MFLERFGCYHLFIYILQHVLGACRSGQGEPAVICFPQNVENTWTGSVPKVERSGCEDLIPFALLLFNRQSKFSLHFQVPEALGERGSNEEGRDCQVCLLPGL